jgi:DNA-binding HxlR family transcriptional regulator
MDENILKKYSDTGNCPVRNVLERFGDKWSLLVLMLLEDEKVLRFSEISGYIQSISQKMLAVTLKSLEADGLVKRTVFPQIPPKVEYELTLLGRSLLPHLHSLAQWAVENMEEIKVSRLQHQAGMAASA